MIAVERECQGNEALSDKYFRLNIPVEDNALDFYEVEKFGTLRGSTEKWAKEQASKKDSDISKIIQLMKRQ